MRLIAVVTVALLFSGSATAYATWARSASLRTGTQLTTGSLSLSAVWVGAPPTFTGWPGETRKAVVHLTSSGPARWRYTVAATGGALTNGAVVTYETTSGSPATCTGTTLTQPSPVLPAGGSADVCVVVKQPPGVRSAADLTVTFTAQNESTT